jgi:hypothetical protein
MRPFPSPYRVTRTRGRTIAAGVLAMAMLPASVGAARGIDQTLPADPEPAVACFAAPGDEPEWLAIDPEPKASVVTATATPVSEPGPRSLVLAAESRITREEASRQSVSRGDERRTPLSARPPVRLEYPARAWPFALGVAADALTTQWALQRGCFEKNPFLGVGGLDATMMKIVEFPLLALAVDSLERRHPRLGRRLRWATLAFHGALAFHNVRLGLAAGRASALPASSASGRPR